MTASQQGDPYADPEVYDVLHDTGSDKTFETLRTIANRYRPGARCWLEPGCGTGRLLRQAKRQQLTVIGFDRSPAMLDYARKHLPGSTLVEADLTAFSDAIGHQIADFAFALDNTIRHLDPDQLTVHLCEMGHSLRAGGVYVIGLDLLAPEFPHGSLPQAAQAWDPDLREEDLWEEDVWEGERDGWHVYQFVSCLPEGALERVIAHLNITRPDGSTEHRNTCHDLWRYRVDTFRRRVAASPLEWIAWLNWYGDETELRSGGGQGCHPGYGMAVLRRT